MKMKQSDIRRAIMRIVDDKCGAYWSDFVKAIDADHQSIQVELNELLKDGTLRQKDDDVEHDWEFIRNRYPVYESGSDAYSEPC